MPISYDVHGGGHFISAVASAPLTIEEFVEYEVAHAMDGRISPPVSELFTIQQGAFSQITMDDMLKLLERRKTGERSPTPHRCAIVVALGDAHAWELAKFYEGMAKLHYPESVIVFGDEHTAKIYLGVGAAGPAKA